MSASAVTTSRVRRLSACISVADLDRSIKWYSDVLGFRLRRQAPFPDLGARLAFLEVDDLRLELVQSDGSVTGDRPDPPRHAGVRGVTQLTLYVDDLDQVLAELAEHGVPLAMPPVDVEVLGIRAFFIRDADGNLIEFIQGAGEPAEPTGQPIEQES